MLKRFLVIGCVVAAALNLGMAASQLAFSRGWLTRSENDRSARRFGEVVDLIRRNYVDGSKSAAEPLTETALKEMVRTLDPHSDYLSANDYREFQAEMKSEFGGVGVQVEVRDKKITVIAPIAGTPAERAGVLRGDQIVAVDGQSLEEPTMDEVVDKLRGKPGTKVALRLFRPVRKESVELTVVREIIRVQSVRTVEKVEEGIGYVALTQFAEPTGREFKEAVQRLEKEGLRALIIDLRNNPGGLLDAAVEVVEPFFEKGELVVYTQGRDPKSRSELRADGRQRSSFHPIAVLINSGSASAAEIVAGALKDTHRAVIIGERSFGKGSVQTIFQVSGGAGLRLTTAKYYTPSGVTIHGNGIEPDVTVLMSEEDDGKLRLQRARRDLENPDEFKERFGFDPIEDRQLETAIAVLKAALFRADAPEGSATPKKTAASATPDSRSVGSTDL